MVAGSYFWEANTLYVWCTDSGDPNAESISCPAFNGGIVYINGQHDIKFDNLGYKRGLSQSGFDLSSVEGVYNIDFDDIDFCVQSRTGINMSADLVADITWSYD